jgi:hypothetical protein
MSACLEIFLIQLPDVLNRSGPMDWLPARNGKKKSHENKPMVIIGLIFAVRKSYHCARSVLHDYSQYSSGWGPGTADRNGRFRFTSSSIVRLRSAIEGSRTRYPRPNPFVIEALSGILLEREIISVLENSLKHFRVVALSSRAVSNRIHVHSLRTTYPSYDRTSDTTFVWSVFRKTKFTKT